MALADMIPTLDDAALASLLGNARRLEATAGGRQQQQAAEALPLIEAELAVRLARKPPKKKAAAKPRVAKAKVAKVVEEAEESDESDESGEVEEVEAA